MISRPRLESLHWETWSVSEKTNAQIELVPINDYRLWIKLTFYPNPKVGAKMSILNWVRRGTLGNKTPNSSTLPDPTEIENTKEAQITAVCNAEVENVTTPRKRKRSEYGSYTPETRAKMARYASISQHSQKEHFSTEKSSPNRWGG